MTKKLHISYNIMIIIIKKLTNVKCELFKMLKMSYLLCFYLTTPTKAKYHNQYCTVVTIKKTIYLEYQHNVIA